MAKTTPKRSGYTSRASIETIRSQADDLLRLLDECGLAEAAALMATAVDAIDTSLRHLPANRTSPDDMAD